MNNQSIPTTDNSSGLYSIQDLRGGVFHPPFPARSDADARRIVFKSLEGVSDALPVLYPSDFCIVRWCSWSSAQGIPLGLSLQPKLVCILDEIIKPAVGQQTSIPLPSLESSNIL